MPFISVSMLPKMPPQKLEKLKHALQEATAGIQELGLEPHQITVAYPTDQLESPGHEVIAKMDCILDKPERTKAVIERLAEAVKFVLVGFAANYLLQCQMVEVFAEVFGNPSKNAVAVWHRP